MSKPIYDFSEIKAQYLDHLDVVDFIEQFESDINSLGYHSIEFQKKYTDSKLEYYDRIYYFKGQPIISLDLGII